jgi:hypothetical protein
MLHFGFTMADEQQARIGQEAARLGRDAEASSSSWAATGNGSPAGEDARRRNPWISTLSKAPED